MEAAAAPSRSDVTCKRGTVQWENEGTEKRFVKIKKKSNMTNKKNQTEPVGNISKRSCFTILIVGITLMVLGSCSFKEKGDIYIVGSEFVNHDYQVAKLWKNGKELVLTKENYGGVAYSVYVYDNDVYVIGIEGKVEQMEMDIKGKKQKHSRLKSTVGKVWKNGITLYELNGIPESIYVYNDTIYVVGWGNSNKPIFNIAKLWINGNEQILTKGTYGEAKSVFVSDNNVYIIGSENDGNWILKDNQWGINNYPRLWINGVSQNFTSVNDVELKSIYVSDDDVYIVGIEYVDKNRIAKLWKNGTPQALTTNGNYGGEANSVFVSDGVVYVVGWESEYVKNETDGYYNNRVAKLWKNGIAQNLTNGEQSMTTATSVFALDKDIYVIGEGSNGVYSIVKLWKNGVEYDITDGTTSGHANSIFVKRRSLLSRIF